MALASGQTLESYSDLKTVAAEWLNRRDLTNAVPLFITLAEAELRRRLRTKKFRQALTVDAEVVTLPAECAELLSIYLRTSLVQRDKPLDIGTAEMFAEARARSGGIAARPTFGTVIGQQLLVAPTPDQSYEAEIWFAAKIDSLSTSNITNWLLAEHPDIYLHATLLQAEPYLKNDERVEIWRTALDRGVEQLKTAVSDEENSASLRAARLPVVF